MLITEKNWSLSRFAISVWSMLRDPSLFLRALIVSLDFFWLFMNEKMRLGSVLQNFTRVDLYDRMASLTDFLAARVALLCIRVFGQLVCFQQSKLGDGSEE